MSLTSETTPFEARYSYGGDEYIFVELAEAMSLSVNFRAMAITNRLQQENIEGITDICPSNASYLIRIDPDVLHPDELIARLKELDEEVGDVRGFELRIRVVDVPVMIEDPWTHETLMRFRACPSGTRGTEHPQPPSGWRGPGGARSIAVPR
jgi:urea carboxylase